MILLRLLIPIVLIGLYILSESWAYGCLLPFFESDSAQNLYTWIYWGISIFSILGMIIPGILMARSEGKRNAFLNFILGLAGSFFICKILYAPFVILTKLTGLSIIALIGLGIVGFGFLWMLHGITLGKYNYKVSHVQVPIKDLPKEFEGFSIAQISDIHAGTFDSEKGVQKGVDMVNDQNTDLILFTGDLVNGNPKEIKPFYSIFSQLKAPDGVYSVLGNHDYYQFRWSKESSLGNYQFCKEQHQMTGFKLLLNEHVFIERNGKKLALVGVENWGVPPFPQIGDLDRAAAGTEDAAVRILMSHDPSHFSEKVIKHPIHMHLTLSGHTHAMQFGINFLGIKWSPVQYRYKQWWGLYKDAGRYLYVNRGFGFLGFPGRVGMFPEIAVFELTNVEA